MQTLFFKYIFIVVLGGGTLECLQRFLQCIKYIILEFTLSTVLFHPLSPPLIPEQFQQVSFLHLLTCVCIICTIFILLHVIKQCGFMLWGAILFCFLKNTDFHSYSLSACPWNLGWRRLSGRTLEWHQAGQTLSQGHLWLHCWDER
jgi:hypothetical protein